MQSNSHTRQIVWPRWSMIHGGLCHLALPEFGQKHFTSSFLSVTRLSSHNRWVDATPNLADSAASPRSVPDCSGRPFFGTLYERRKTYGKMGLITDQTRRSEYGGFAACVTSHEYLRRSAALRRSRGTEFRISVPYVCPTDASCRCWQPPLVFKPVVWPARSR